MHARQHPRDQRDHAGVDDEQEQAQGHQSHRQGQQDGDGPHDGIDHAEQQAGEDQGGRCVDGDALDPQSRQPQPQRGDRGTDEKTEHDNLPGDVPAQGRYAAGSGNIKV